MVASGTAFDFELVPDRRGSDSVKWNKYAGRDILPLWVADMDFASPPAVLSALQARVARGDLGYAEPWPALVETVRSYCLHQYDWQIEAEWLVWLPGLVCGINLACRSVEGDVLTATPVYPPFLSAPGLAGRALARVPLREEGGVWGWDFAALEAALTPSTRLLLLCHPHNPVGRAWREEELSALADFAARHDLIVCSDEIHCDLVLDAGRRHVPYACLNETAARHSITLMAPSKTYNIAGLGCSLAIIPDPELRRRYRSAMRGIVPDVNVLALTACAAAMQDGEPWRQALLGVLRANRDRVKTAVDAMPGLRMGHVEATYLAWIDALGLGVESPCRFFENAGVGLSDGADFGLPGWVRLNFGCTPAVLEQALQRMREACLARTA